MFWGVVALAWIGSGVGASQGNGLQAVVMLVASFALLLLINLLQKWSRRYHRV